MTTFTDNWLRTAGPDRIELDRAAGVIRRTPPADHPADRPHRIRAAVAAPDGTWTDHVLDIDGPETPFDAGDRPVLLDPYLDTWALTVPDELDHRGARDAAAAGRRTRSCAPASGATSAAPCTTPRSTRSTCSRWPSAACRSRTPRTRPGAPWPGSTPGWSRCSRTRPPRSRGCTTRRSAKLDAASPASEEQLAAFRAAIGTATDPELLRGWVDGDLPEGVPVDLDLRWRVLVRLATLGAVDRAELDRRLDDEPTAVARVRHAAARASLPDRRGQGLGVGLLHRRDQPAQLRARGGRPRLLAGRPGELLDAVRRPLLRRPARDGQGAQRLGAGRGRRGLLPAHVADRARRWRAPRR